ncbi:granzyme B(G,H) [Colossoma macropomum]|uniref:granzyme B(G,H) n=1 Tax=Colossoma macropomum TaxID=42526 RepID=UPI0018653040|nr:granzyme B(G,H) [Colossoma macropomum]
MSVLLCLGAFILLQNLMPGGSTRQGIIGGKESVPHSHPFMVYIVDIMTGNTCDGFLVNENFVVTAAHCNGRIVAFLGVHSTKGLIAKNSAFVKTIPHPEYNCSTYENDIMLLKLCKPAQFSKTVMPVALPASENESFGHNCLVMGWGCQTFCKEFPSEVLQEVNVTISKTKNCTAPDIMCSEGFKGPGQGDSGGPLVCGNVAHGIVSSNYKAGKDYVSRYVRLTYHLKWIRSIINGTYQGC